MSRGLTCDRCGASVRQGLLCGQCGNLVDQAFIVGDTVDGTRPRARSGRAELGAEDEDRSSGSDVRTTPSVLLTAEDRLVSAADGFDGIDAPTEQVRSLPRHGKTTVEENTTPGKIPEAATLPTGAPVVKATQVPQPVFSPADLPDVPDGLSDGPDPFEVRHTAKIHDNRLFRSGTDAVVLGDPSDIGESLLIEQPDGDYGEVDADDFLTATTESSRRVFVPVQVYIGRDIARMLADDVVLRVRPDIDLNWVPLSPFERFVIGEVDGLRPVARIQARMRLSADDLRLALALLLDKGIIEPKGVARPINDVPTLTTVVGVATDDIVSDDDVVSLNADGADDTVAAPAAKAPGLDLTGDDSATLELPSPLPARPSQPKTTPAPPSSPPRTPAPMRPGNPLLSSLAARVSEDPTDTTSAPTPPPWATPQAPTPTTPPPSSRGLGRATPFDSSPSPSVVVSGPAPVVANPFAQPPTAPEVPRQKEPPPRSRGFVIADRGRGQAAQLHAQALADIRDGALGRAWQLACMAAAAAPDDPRYQETIANWAAVVAEHQTPADARLYAQAIRKESLGDAQGAITLLRQAIAENANNAAAHNRLGVLLAASHGDLREAVAALERAVALAPDDATFRNNLGKVAAAAERKGLASLFKLIGRR